LKYFIQKILAVQRFSTKSADTDLPKNMQKAIALCSQKMLDSKVVLDDFLVLPFRLKDCMLFLSRQQGEFCADVTVSDPLFLDFEIKSMHLNTRFVTNTMVEYAIKQYGTAGAAPYATAFLFRDGCGFVKFEPDNGYFHFLIERQPDPIDFEIGFSQLKG
jgi:hypothetical protein